MVTEVRDILRLVAGAEVFWSTTEIVESLNDAILELSDFAEYHRDVVAVEVGERTYVDLKTAIPNLLYPISIYDPTLKKWVATVHIVDLDVKFVRWENVIGRVMELFVRNLFWLGGIFKDLQRPTWKMWCALVDGKLTEGYMSPKCPDEWHTALVNYAVYDLLAQDREVDKALGYWKRYMDDAVKLKDFVERRNEYDHWQHVGGGVM